MSFSGIDSHYYIVKTKTVIISTALFFTIIINTLIHKNADYTKSDSQAQLNDLLSGIIN